MKIHNHNGYKSGPRKLILSSFLKFFGSPLVKPYAYAHGVQCHRLLDVECMEWACSFSGILASKRLRNTLGGAECIY